MTTMTYSFQAQDEVSPLFNWEAEERHPEKIAEARRLYKELRQGKGISLGLPSVESRLDKLLAPIGASLTVLDDSFQDGEHARRMIQNLEKRAHVHTARALYHSLRQPQGFSGLERWPETEIRDHLKLAGEDFAVLDSSGKASARTMGARLMERAKAAHIAHANHHYDLLLQWLDKKQPKPFYIASCFPEVGMIACDLHYAGAGIDALKNLRATGNAGEVSFKIMKIMTEKRLDDNLARTQKDLDTAGVAAMQNLRHRLGR